MFIYLNIPSRLIDAYFGMVEIAINIIFAPVSSCNEARLTFDSCLVLPPLEYERDEVTPTNVMLYLHM